MANMSGNLWMKDSGTLMSSWKAKYFELACEEPHAKLRWWSAEADKHQPARGEVIIVSVTPLPDRGGKYRDNRFDVALGDNNAYELLELSASAAGEKHAWVKAIGALTSIETVESHPRAHHFSSRSLPSAAPTPASVALSAEAVPVPPGADDEDEQKVNEALKQKKEETEASGDNATDDVDAAPAAEQGAQTPSRASPRLPQFVVLHDFVPEHHAELGVHAGDLVTRAPLPAGESDRIGGEDFSGWMRVQVLPKAGFVPAAFTAASRRAQQGDRGRVVMTHSFRAESAEQGEITALKGDVFECPEWANENDKNHQAMTGAGWLFVCEEDVGLARGSWTTGYVPADFIQPIDYPVGRGSGTATMQQPHALPTRGAPLPSARSPTNSACLLFPIVFILLLPAACAPVLLFSKIGRGADVFTALAEGSTAWRLMLLGGVGLLVLLYIFDVSYWHDAWSRPKQFLVGVGLLTVLAAATMSNTSYPALPFCIFVYLVPLCAFVVRHYILASQELTVFLRSFAYSAWTYSIAMFALWGTWVTGAGSIGDFGKTHHWSAQLRKDYTTLTCHTYDPTIEDTACLAAFILWGSPFIAAVAIALFGLAALLLSNAIVDSHKRDATSMHVTDGEGSSQLLHRQNKLQATINATAIAMVMLLFCLWCSASIAGADMGLANVVNAFGGFGFLLLCASVTQTMGWHAIQQGADTIPLVRKVASLFSSDWTKACLIMGLTPLALVYALLSFLNQSVRRCTRGLTSCSKNLSAADHDETLLLTKRATRQFTVIRSWPASSVLDKICTINAFVIVFMVGVGKAVTIGLAWLNEALEPVSYGSVIGIFWAVGLTMFLLPPVPGVPVYIAGGVILTYSGTHSGNLTFGVAVTYACLICLGIKLTAILAQQKGIGEQLKSRVGVRAAVGINSITIRAIRSILSEPGLAFLSIKKVSILCGGPDWPVSVLTGILGLSATDMLLGSLPVLFVIAPTCMAGAFVLKVNEGGSWESIASVMLAACVMVQSGALIAAAYFIEQVASHDAAKLKAEPDDVEVLELNKRAQRKRRMYVQATKWEAVPLVPRVALILAAILMTLSMYAIMLMGSRCFRTFSVSGRISEPFDEGGLNGRALNLVRPQGWYAITAFGLGLLLQQIFKCWASRRVKAFADTPATPQDEDKAHHVVDLPQRARTGWKRMSAAFAFASEASARSLQSSKPRRAPPSAPNTDAKRSRGPTSPGPCLSPQQAEAQLALQLGSEATV